MTPQTIGDLAEARVARYLRERGYPFEVEPEFGTGRHPDFLITAGEHTVVAEVKAFETYGIFKDLVPGQLMSRSLEEALAPIRGKIKEAAGQLKGLQDRGWPLVVILDNPGGRPIPLNSPHMIISAMYGDLTYEASLDPGGALGDFQAVAGRNGKLRNHHAYISAVAVVQREDHASPWASQWFADHREEFALGGADDDRGAKAMGAAFAEASKDAPDGDDIFLEVFETLSDSAEPLPRDVFNGPRDLRWVPNGDRTALTPSTASTSTN